MGSLPLLMMGTAFKQIIRRIEGGGDIIFYSNNCLQNSFTRVKIEESWALIFAEVSEDLPT